MVGPRLQADGLRAPLTAQRDQQTKEDEKREGDTDERMRRLDVDSKTDGDTLSALTKQQ